VSGPFLHVSAYFLHVSAYSWEVSGYFLMMTTKLIAYVQVAFRGAGSFFTSSEYITVFSLYPSKAYRQHAYNVRKDDSPLIVLR